MPTALNPYLNFRDSAREAMEFYHSVFGGELTRSTFAEFQVSDDPAEAEKIMHSALDVGTGFLIMASDVPNGMEHSDDSNGTVSLSGDDEATLTDYWTKLTEGGTITLPLEKAPWGDSFGQFVDRFGVRWLVNIAGAPSQ